MSRFLLWRRGTSRHVDCKRAGAWLQSYLDGELDDARYRAVARHLDECRGCGMEAEAYRELTASLRRGVPAFDAIEETASLARLRDFAGRLAAGDIGFGHEVDTGL